MCQNTYGPEFGPIAISFFSEFIEWVIIMYFEHRTEQSLQWTHFKPSFFFTLYSKLKARYKTRLAKYNYL